MLETVIALAILSLALMAIFDLNSGAVRSHVFAKRLTVASLLARSKMTDLEQKLYDQALPSDDQEEKGDFSEEGWPSYKWHARILVPKTDGVPPEQLISALFNIPVGSGSGLGALFGSGQSPTAGSQGTTGGTGAGPLAGFAQQQLSQMATQISQAVREVRLTVSWQEGTTTDSLDVVTHVVSLGPGSDRNGMTTQAGAAAQGYVNPRTGQAVSNPVPCAQNPTQMCDPQDPSTVLAPAGATSAPALAPSNPFPMGPSGGIRQ